MKTHHWCWTMILVPTLLAGCSQPEPPELAWEGKWEAAPDGHGGELRCTLVPGEEGQWQGKFTGYCNQQFAYEVQMEGRREGSAIHFQGSADLGEKDGGVYHWTGQIAGQEFFGQYRSTAGKTGKFQMKPAGK
jgi:hypothetical protein